jgi:hypothetical protein
MVKIGFFSYTSSSRRSYAVATTKILSVLGSDVSDIVNGWRNNCQKRGDLEDKDVILAYSKQSQSGWKNFFEGRPCHQWAQIQSTYFRDALRSYQSGKRWLTEVIKKCGILLGIYESTGMASYITEKRKLKTKH